MITTCLFSFRVNKFVYLFHNLFFLINALHCVLWGLLSLYFVYCILKYKTKHDVDDVEHAQSMHHRSLLQQQQKNTLIDDNTDIRMSSTSCQYTKLLKITLDHTRTRRWDPIETANGMKLKKTQQSRERVSERRGREKKHLKKRKAN